MWVGTGAGAAVFDGHRWASFTTASGLPDNVVLSIAIDPRPQGDRVWFGTQRGIARLDTATGEWGDTASEDIGLEWDSVADVLVDASGRLWAATLGGGLGLWDGDTWHFYRVSNSEIPFNTVQALFEAEPGVLWVGTSLPNDVGGVLATYDGTKWTAYTRRNSGFPGAEPLTIARDGEGRLWIGTRTGGVYIYHPQQ